MKNYKAPDGSFSHFEMKGGPFEHWVRELNEVVVVGGKARDAMRELEREDFHGGTAVAWLSIEAVLRRVERVLESMEKFRMESFGMKEEQT